MLRAAYYAPRFRLVYNWQIFALLNRIYSLQLQVFYDPVFAAIHRATAILVTELSYIQVSTFTLVISNNMHIG